MIVYNKKTSKLQEANSTLSFSLVDYRNNYFTSPDPHKIIEFYNGFVNRTQLIEWMEERPKGVANIYEVDGNKDVVIVIPTSDFNGKYAKECRENIFNGLHIIFVESGEVPDPYFNYAHNCNVGIKKAMEYNPKWIVVSNDDMVKIDNVDLLVKELGKNDNNRYNALFAQPSRQHSSVSSVGRRRKFVTNIFLFFYYTIKYWDYSRYILVRENEWFLAFNQKSVFRYISRIAFKDLHNYFVTMDFTILSTSWCTLEIGKGNDIFDETYINGCEDHDLSLRLSLDHDAYKFIQYRIDGIGGATFDPSHDENIIRRRTLLALANLIYLDKKLKGIFQF